MNLIGSLRIVVCLVLGVMFAEATGAAENAFRFVVLSDTHVGRNDGKNSSYYQELVAEIVALEPRPAAVFVTGDLTDHGLESEYDNYLAWIVKPLRAAGIPHYALPGNHELGGDTNHNTLAVWTTKLGALHQSVDIQKTHFILTSGLPEGVTGGYGVRGAQGKGPGIGQAGFVGSNELAWIASDLATPAAKSAQVTILMNHFPLWKKDFGGYEIQDVDYFGNSTGAGTKLREWVDREGVDIVMAGHRHYQTNAFPHVGVSGRTAWAVLNESMIMGKVEQYTEAKGRVRNGGVVGYDVYDVDGRTVKHYRQTVISRGGKELGPRNSFTIETP